jgi:hypothetical protein
MTFGIGTYIEDFNRYASAYPIEKMSEAEVTARQTIRSFLRNNGSYDIRVDYTKLDKKIIGLETEREEELAKKLVKILESQGIQVTLKVNKSVPPKETQSPEEYFRFI